MTWLRRMPRDRTVLTEVGPLLANGIGAVIVFVLLRFVVPIPVAAEDELLSRRNVIGFAIYLPVAMAIGSVVGLRLMHPIRRWQRRGGTPTDAERRRILRLPLLQMSLHATSWCIGGLLAVVLNAFRNPRLAVAFMLAAMLGGVTVWCIGYLIAARILRPLTAQAMAEWVPEGTQGPSVSRRLLLTWAFTTAVPSLGVVLIATAEFDSGFLTANERIGPSVLAIAVVGLVASCIGSVLVARSVSDPIQQVSRAMADVERGSDSVRVDVYDASEIGRLQAGFNQMVAGLAEREQLRDLFGKHVGVDVAKRALAKRALERGTDLGGESREVAVLFVDITGSTTITATYSPDDLVAVLNEFFRVVVETIDIHGGFINKFEGDAALAVFGAPLPIENHCSAALAAARELRIGLAAIVPIEAGIGVSAGMVVAGNIGSASRYEYTVIGDPVNEAARLTELAKARSSRVLASRQTVAGADPDEAARWRILDEVTLRGRSQPTRLAEPVD